MQTIAGVIDQLTIVNIRIWHLIDRSKDFSLSDKERLEAHDKVVIANGQRNKLIDELDSMINNAFIVGKTNIFKKLKI